MSEINLEIPDPVGLSSEGDELEAVHVFDKKSWLAIQTSLAACRPLLVKGEPGLGKTQLAQAAARVLKRQLISYTVGADSDGQSLLWEFDAIERLAEAQIIKNPDIEEVRKHLSVEKFVRPGPVWRAFNWDDANRRMETLKCFNEVRQKDDWVAPENGCVLLIDEIDKAENDLPNYLLESFGSGKFFPKGFSTPVTYQKPVPLIIITTNNDRTLPQAFTRRCIVLKLSFPKDEELLDRAKVHFPQASSDLLEKALEFLKKQREKGGPKPGQAEYLDLLRASLKMAKGNSARALEYLDEISPLVFEKYR